MFARKKQKKENQETAIASGINFLIPATESVIPADPCSGGMCSIHRLCLRHPLRLFFLLEAPIESLSVANDYLLKNNSYVEQLNDYLSVISPELSEIIKNAAFQGLTSASILTVLSESITPILKGQNYTAEQIYWINQFIRGLALINMGASPYLTVSLPLINHFLAQYSGLERGTVSTLTAGVVIGASVLMSPLGVVPTSLAVAASVGASLLGNKVTTYGFNTMKHYLFPPKKVEGSVVAANLSEPTKQNTLS